MKERIGAAGKAGSRDEAKIKAKIEIKVEPGLMRLRQIDKIGDRMQRSEATDPLPAAFA